MITSTPQVAGYWDTLLGCGHAGHSSAVHRLLDGAVSSCRCRAESRAGVVGSVCTAPLGAPFVRLPLRDSSAGGPVR